MKMKVCYLFWVFAVVPMLSSADVTVDYGTDVTIDVPAEESLVIEGNVRAADGAGALDKTGGGSLTLPAGGVWTRDKLDVNVREGAISVSADGSIPASTPENPPAAMQKAAFWLEASKNTAAWDEDKTRIKTWYDVRESKSENGEWSAEYFRAVALPAKSDTGVIDAVTNFPVIAHRTAASGERSMMYFHGKNSGSYMRYAKPDGVHGPVNGIVHAFAVLDIDVAYGYIFGAWNTVVFLHPGRIDTQAANGYYVNPAACGPALPNGRFYIDGKITDPGIQVKTGVQVIELECGELTGSVETIFSDRNYTKRYGGDWVGEIVLFTNRLSDVERFDVSEYLLRKWKGEPSAATVNVNLARGTVAEVAKSAMAQANISGTGTVLLDGEVEYVPSAANRFAGNVSIKEGANASIMGVNELPVAIEPGDRIVTSGKDSFDVFKASRAKNASDAAQAKASHTGAATLRVTSLAGVKEFSSGAGQLTLSVPRRMDNTLGTNIWATVAGGNSGFEGFLPASVHLIKRHGVELGAPIEANGWRLQARDIPRPDGKGTAVGWVYIGNAVTIIDGIPTKDSWLFGLNDEGNLAVYDKNRFYPPEGSVVAIIKVAGTISADMVIPESGDYELTYYGTGRIKYDYAAVSLSLVDDSVTPAVTNKIARYLQPALDGWKKYKFLLRGVKEGTYKLLVDAQGLRYDADCCAIFDDFQVKLLTRPDNDTVCAFPPNASFEVTDSPYDMRNVYTPSNTVQNWTLVQNVGSLTVPTNCEVCFSSRWHGDHGRWFNTGSRYGESQLLLRESNGYVQSDAFTLPAGTWRLHLRGTRWAFDGAAYAWHGHSLNSAPSVYASVTVNGEETSLGTSVTFPMRDYTMREYTLPNTFTIAEGMEVVLKLRQGTQASVPASGDPITAAASVDEVWFERVDQTKPGGELIAGGDFVDKSLWTMQSNKIEGDANTDKCLADVRTVGNNKNYGYTTCGDEWALLLVQVGQATQRVTFPEAGLYKLSFWTRSRYSTDLDTGVVLAYFGGNQVKAWLADDNGVKQEIYRTQSIYSTNFYEHVVMFNVEAPGTYTFGLQGCNSYPDHVTTRSSEAGQKDSNVFVDCVSIKKASDSDMPELDEELQLNLSAASKLRLDFAGTATIKGLRIGGRKVSGLIDASHPSGLVSGPGCLYIQPEGTVILFR